MMTSERGVAMLWAVSLTALLLLTILGYYPFFGTVLRVNRHAADTGQTIDLAQAGIDEALWEANFAARESRRQTGVDGNCFGADLTAKPECRAIDYNRDSGINISEATSWSQGTFRHFCDGYRNWCNVASCPDPNNCATYQKTATLTDGIRNTTIGNYTVTVSGIKQNPVQSDWNPIIVSTGTHASSPSLTKTVRVVLSKEKSKSAMNFRFAAWGGEMLSFVHEGGGMLVDSYNSNLAGGVYGAVVSPADPIYGGLNRSQSTNLPSWNADIGTNALAEVATGTTVWGGLYLTRNAYQLLDGTIQEGTTYHLGYTLPAASEIQWPNTAGWATPSGTGVTVDGSNNVTVSGAGTNWTCDGSFKANTLTVTNNATVTLSTSCQLAVEAAGSNVLVVNAGGTMSVASGSTSKVWLPQGRFNVNSTAGITAVSGQTPKPKDFQLYVGATGGGTNSLYQDSAFTGMIYAPESSIWVESGSTIDVFGSMVSGRNLIFNFRGTGRLNLHYDESLKNYRLDGGGTSLPLCVANMNCYAVKSWQLAQ